MIEIRPRISIPDLPIGEKFRVVFGENVNILVRVREYSPNEPNCKSICTLKDICDFYGFAKCRCWERKDGKNVIYEKI